MRSPARGLLLLLCVLLALAMVPSPGRGELPSVVTHADASRTVTWTMNDSTSLTTQSLVFGGGNASLPWTDSILSWPNGTAINSGGAIDLHMAASPSGISLKQNWSNRLADGNFIAASPWSYVNGSMDNTTATWQSQTEDVRINHTSSATQTMWDSLDIVPGTWAGLGLCGNSNLFKVPGGDQKQGAAALGDYINVSAGSTCWAGAQNLSGLSVNWDAYDQLNIWIHLNRSAPAAFQISAFNGATQYLTVPVDLSLDWQDVAVDLNQLGSPRTTLSSITLRIVGVSGQAVSNLAVYFDAIRVGRAKVADTTAHVYQRFAKGQSTTPLQGSAFLSFDWSFTNASGVAEYVASANLSRPSGFVNTSLVPSSFGGWSHFTADVSPTVTATGTYNLSFSLRVVLDNISASNVTLLIDNASFVFPGTQNGTYLSDLQTMGLDSQYTSLAWVAALPTSETTVTLALRTGNTTSMGDPTWSGWQTWSASPGIPTVPGAVYFQLRADLATTNASVTPVLESLALSTQHHIDHGSVLSGVFRADSTILSWSAFDANFSSVAGTTVTFEVGNGSFMVSVASSSTLSSVLQGSFIQWQAVLSTTDGLLTPTLHSISVTYEYLGPPVRLVITHAGFAAGPSIELNVTSGQYLQLGALVYDAGSHPVPSSLYVVGWSIDNATGGSVQSNGTYLAGKPGLWRITAVLVGTTIYASVQVNVTAGTNSSSTPFNLWDAWPLILIVVAALAGFSIYEILVRRLFAIDDVFLIAKDGRLIVHNTRRMRADRDEDILSGMLTAIMSFLRDQDPEENGELKRFQVGGKTTLLERGPHAYLTAIYSGRVPRWAGKDLHRFMMDLEERFGERFAHWSGSPEDLHGLKEFMRPFVTQLRYRGNRANRGRAS